MAQQVTASTLIDRGDLRRALARAQGEVKAAPADQKARTLLFALHCFAENWSKAEHQLEVLMLQNPAAAGGAAVFQSLLAAEETRRDVLAGRATPTYLLPPPDFCHCHLQALQAIAGGNLASAAGYLRESAAARSLLYLKGTLNGRAFRNLSDGDDVLAPVLEFMIHDRYCWIPFSQLKGLMMEKPSNLCDLLWIAGRIELIGGRAFGGYVPVRYAASSRHPDERVHLGRVTKWQPLEGGMLRGLGQRTLLIGDEAVGVLEIRELECAQALACGHPSGEASAPCDAA